MTKEQIEALALEAYPDLTEDEEKNMDDFKYELRYWCKQSFIHGLKKASKLLYSEEQMLGFLEFYNSFDFNKQIGFRYKPPTMDGSEKEFNKNIDKKILKEYIQSLKQG